MSDPTFPPRYPVAVDVVALTVLASRLCALIVTRDVEPYRGCPALPGGFVLPGEDLEAAAARELGEETGIVDPPGHLEQLATYGAVGRDPRGRVVSVAYLLLAPGFGPTRAGSDARGAEWRPVSDLTATDRLAFDHDRILADGVERARAKLEYSPLATAFCPPTFTIAQLRKVYEAVWGVGLDPRNFHRKATTTPGFLRATGERVTGSTGRPAALYELEPGTDPTGAILNPPLLRP